MGSPAVAAALARRLRAGGATAWSAPMADGGEGTLLALVAQGAVPAAAPAHSPLGQPITALYGRMRGAVFVESAAAVGLHLDPRRRPLAATSYGLGWLIRAALADAPGAPLVVGLGGSATMDGGLGLAQALGLTALDVDGAPIPDGAGAGALSRVARLVGPRPLRDTLARAWADVQTPLGDAARVFGPQKGADPVEVARIERGLIAWAAAVNDWRRRQGRAPVDPAARGTGAAGGLGFAAAAILDAPLAPGAAAMARAADLDASLVGADAVVTGEGRLDTTSFEGKVVGEVTRRARRAGVPRVIALCGAREGALPPPPVGPDAVIVCDDLPGGDRAARFAAGLSEVAARLRSG